MIVLPGIIVKPLKRFADERVFYRDNAQGFGPLDNHEIWEDSIEWRNAVEEAKKLKRLIEELK